jgi:hypothetical protein
LIDPSSLPQSVLDEYVSRAKSAQIDRKTTAAKVRSFVTAAKREKSTCLNDGSELLEEL